MNLVRPSIFYWSNFQEQIVEFEMGTTNRRFCRNFRKLFGPFSAVSRDILKPLYWFGVPNQDSQTLKSVDFWCKLSSPFVVAEPQYQCFELFRMQNNQNFLGLCPWILWERAYSTKNTMVKVCEAWFKKNIKAILGMGGKKGQWISLMYIMHVRFKI